MRFLNLLIAALFANMISVMIGMTVLVLASEAKADDNPMTLDIGDICNEKQGCIVLLNFEQHRYGKDDGMRGEVPGKYVNDPLLAFQGMHVGMDVPGNIIFRLLFAPGQPAFFSLEDVADHLQSENLKIRAARATASGS